MVFASDLNTKLTQKVLFESFNLVADADFSEIETEIFGKKQELMLKVEHIGIAVKNLTDSVPLFEKLLNSKCYKTEEVEIEKVKTAFLKTGETKIELLESTDPDGIIANYIGKRGEGVHHIAFEVADIESEINRLEKEGFTILDKTPKPGADNKMICFLHPKTTNGILIELCMEKK